MTKDEELASELAAEAKVKEAEYRLAESNLKEAERKLAESKPLALAAVDQVLAKNRGVLALLKDGAEPAQIDRALELSRGVRLEADRLAPQDFRLFASRIAELDAQIAELGALRRAEAPVEDAGAGSSRVLDGERFQQHLEEGLARYPQTQTPDFVPLRDKVLQARSHLKDGVALNADARALIREITGKPVIESIEEVMEDLYPGLLKAFYPRVYENVGRYCSPRSCAVMIANVIAETMRTGAENAATAYKMLMPGLRYLRDRRMPMFFVAPDLLEAVLRTDFDDDIDWTELQLPYETGIFVLPKGALTHPEDGEVSMLIWSRTKAGVQPSPWPGLPQMTTGNDAFVILGACPETMIWYDSILTANVRRTLRLNNLFYREAGQPIPATKRSTSLDADLTEKDSEFIERMGVLVFGTILAMNARPTLVERGTRLKVVGKGDKAREFWSPNVIGARYKIKREVAKIVDRKFVTGMREHGTHASPRMHWRRGHYRQQPVGPGRKERKQIWLEPCLIGAGEDE